MELPLKNRNAAGQALAEELQDYKECDDVIVLALPRGGVPVAVKVAEALDAELDLMLVRKLGTPGQSELAMGAIASGGSRVMNEDVVRSLNISEDAIRTGGGYRAQGITAPRTSLPGRSSLAGAVKPMRNPCG